MADPFDIIKSANDAALLQSAQTQATTTIMNAQKQSQLSLMEEQTKETNATMEHFRSENKRENDRLTNMTGDQIEQTKNTAQTLSQKS